MQRQHTLCSYLANSRRRPPPNYVDYSQWLKWGGAATPPPPRCDLSPTWSKTVMPNVNAKSLKMAVKMTSEQFTVVKNWLTSEAQNTLKPTSSGALSRTPPGELTAIPQIRYSWWEGGSLSGREPPSQDPHPCSRPFGPRASALCSMSPLTTAAVEALTADTERVMTTRRLVRPLCTSVKPQWPRAAHYACIA